MAKERRSELHREWLTPLQVDFLTRFFATEVGPRFFLTGVGVASAGAFLRRVFLAGFVAEPG